MKTHKIEVTGIENTVVIYVDFFSFGPVPGIEYTQQTALPLSHATPVPNSVSITIYYQDINFITRLSKNSGKCASNK